MQIQCGKSGQPAPKVLKESLHGLSSNVMARTMYCEQFCESMHNSSYQNLNEHASVISNSMCLAASGLVCTLPSRRRPWISDFSLQLIARRNEEREKGNRSIEQALHKEIRQAVRKDRAVWLDNEVAGGGWKGIRLLTRKKRVRPIQLQNSVGEIVVGADKAEVLADYLEKVQWKVQFANLHPTGTNELGEVLPVSEDNLKVNWKQP